MCPPLPHPQLGSRNSRPRVWRPPPAENPPLTRRRPPDLPGQGENYETHKQDQLRRQKEGRNFWKPELASESEANVAADRREHRDPFELQRATKDMAEVNMRYVWPGGFSLEWGERGREENEKGGEGGC